MSKEHIIRSPVFSFRCSTYTMLIDRLGGIFKLFTSNSVLIDYKLKINFKFSYVFLRHNKLDVRYPLPVVLQ